MDSKSSTIKYTPMRSTGNHSASSSSNRSSRTGYKGQSRRGHSQTRSWRRKQKKRRQKRLTILAMCLVFVLVAIFFLIGFPKGKNTPLSALEHHPETSLMTEKPEIKVDLLTINKYSRPGIKRTEPVRDIVIHWTANPGTTAAQNRSYFESLKDTHITSASAHFVVGMDGEIVQCIPTNEIAYAANNRNGDTISIECCVPDKKGAFNQATYDSCVKLTSYLLGKYNLSDDAVIRHHDVTGKDCPKYYVKHPDAWKKMKTDIKNYRHTYGTLTEITAESEGSKQ